MSGEHMDEAIATVGSSARWVRQPLKEPMSGIMDCPEAIPMSRFVEEACRKLAKGVKSIQVLFDVHLGIASCGEASGIGRLMATASYENLPEPIKFRAQVPDNSKVDLVWCSLDTGLIDVVKVIYFPRPLAFQVALDMCSGDAYAPVFRPGPWNIKKGIQWLLSRLGGYHVRWHAFQEKPQEQRREKPVEPNKA